MGSESERLPSLRIGKHLLKVPIFQGGMSIRISGPRLASAVANEGGGGTLGGVGRGYRRPGYEGLSFFQADRQALADDLQETRRRSPTGVIGANVLLACTDSKKLIEIVAQGADFVALGAGLPDTDNLPDLTAYPGLALLLIGSSLQTVRIFCRLLIKLQGRLPDAIIIEEPATAGGHLGVTRKQTIEDPRLLLENVIPESRKWLDGLGYDVPLIAAGGTLDHAGIKHMLSLGARGVQMATSFITTVECDAPDEFKEAILRSTERSIGIMNSPVGLPARNTETEFTRKFKNGEPLNQVPECRYHCLRHCSFRDSDFKEDFCIVDALANACGNNGRVDINNSIVFTGTNGYRAKERGIIKVRDLFAELTAN